MKKTQLVEIARSFSYKLNTGNYESRDFFCSQKAEVPFEEAEETSRALYHFCKSEVIKSVNSYLKEREEANRPPEFPTQFYRAKSRDGGREIIIKEDLQPY